MKLGSEVKLVWIAGMARTGSMWTFNVTRTLIASAGLQVLPDAVPQRDEAMIRIANEGLQDSELRRVRVLKVHCLISADTPKSLFIVPRRDLRDALVSYMRFMRVDFSVGLNRQYTFANTTTASQTRRCYRSNTRISSRAQET